MSRRQVRVVAALIRRGDAVLVQQRRAGSARELLWEFPGGKVDPGETEPEALARECREELDIEVEVGAETFRTRHTYPDLEVELALYACRIVRGEPRQLHANALKFARPPELAQLPFCEADRPIIETLARGEMKSP